MKTVFELIIRYFLLLVIGVVISASFSYAQDSEQQMSKSNLKIFVEYKLVKEHLLTNDNINVEVIGNRIILSGTVPTIYDKHQAEEEAHSVDENYIIVNNLNVQNLDVTDSALTSIILDKIQSNLFYGVFDWITVNTNNGIVTLDGWVHLPWLKSQFQTEVEKIPGVKNVNNEIQNTFGPGELGFRAARLIYNDPMFYGYQYSQNPPIHIIVNNGKVILEGHVNSEIQSIWAANIINYRTDSFSVENNLQTKN
jgi:hyperosmotically inducible protein